jgi:hypothetical protein
MPKKCCHICYHLTCTSVQQVVGKSVGIQFLSEEHRPNDDKANIICELCVRHYKFNKYRSVGKILLYINLV